VCGKAVIIEPSTPPGDAPCPHCGHLLWFNATEQPRSARRLEVVFEVARKKAAGSTTAHDFDYASELIGQCVLGDPSNAVYVRAFVENLHKKYGNNKKGSPLARFMQCNARAAVKEAVSRCNWDEVFKTGLKMLAVNPWDVPTLTALATACTHLARSGDEPASLGFAECSAFYLKCAAHADG
jgi:hypothetical protein